MLEWQDMDLGFAGSGLLAAAALPLLWYVWAAYRGTRPTVSPRLRRALSLLRWLALGLLLAMAAEPILAVLTRRALRPVLLVLLDTSGSMAVEEGEGTRLAAATQVIASPSFAALVEGWQVRLCGFAQAPYALSPDTLGRAAPGGHATDLSRALTDCGAAGTPGDGEPAAALLLTDGAHNLGPDPVTTAAELRAPVFALCVGSETEPADVQIAAVRLPESGYAGQPLPLRAVVRAWGFAGRAVEVAVRDGGRELERRPLTLTGGGDEQVLTFELRPAEAGPHVYGVSVTELEGEQSRDNNQALVFTRIYRGRLPVLLVAGTPGPELAFVGRALAADSSLALERLDPGPRSPSLTGAQLAPYEAVVLVDPGPALLSGVAGQALSAYARAGGGLLLVAGPRTLRHWNSTSPMAEVLPVDLEAGEPVPGASAVVPSPSGRDHPILRSPASASADDTGGAADPWAGLPPVAAWPAGARAHAGATVLLESADGGGRPAAVLGRSGSGRVLVTAAVGLWRLDLMSSGAGESPQVIRRFWQSAVKWLALKSPAGRVRAAPERPVYRAGEEVALVAEVFDELARPQAAARVEASLDGGARRAALESLGSGRYRVSLRGLPAGEHAFEVQAAGGGAPIGSDTGSFIVEAYSLESVDVRARPDLLVEMARVSGGEARRLEDWPALADRLAVTPRLVEEEHRWSLWGHGWLFFAVAGLLSAEWLLRKRHGLL
ncbi:MAG: hypothetical protein ABIL09_12640 [Gemmatimonadota bacterium]